MPIGKVGQLYIPGQGKLEEKIRYRLDNEGHSLLIVKAGISDQEIEDIKSGVVELGLYIDGPIIFLLFKLGTGKWNDAPYSWHTVPSGIRVYPQEAIATGTLQIALVDATDGIVKAVEEVALTPDFADKLNESITIQANGSFNGLSYAKHINMVYNQYAAVEMREMAVAYMSKRPLFS